MTSRAPTPDAAAASVRRSLAEHEQPQRGRADDRDERGAQNQVAHAGAQVGDHVGTELAQRARVLGDGPRRVLAQLRDADLQEHRAVVGVELELTQRRDGDPRATRQRGLQRQLGLERADLPLDRAGDEDGEQRAEHADAGQLQGEEHTAAGGAVRRPGRAVEPGPADAARTLSHR